MHRLTRSAASVALAAALVTLVGCNRELRPNQLADANAAFRSGDYNKAYVDARGVAGYGKAPRAQRDEASLVAGLAAQRLNREKDAEKNLLQAAHSQDAAISGDALASLGLIYAQREDYVNSADAFLRAAARLRGQDKANAYFYAAVAQQKMSQWPQARTNFVLARRASSDPSFHQRVDEQLGVVGYTLQLGAFAEAQNAQEFAESMAQRVIDARLGAPRIVPSKDRTGNAVSVVQIGHFSTFASAAEARDRLGLNEIVIVPLAGQ